MKYKVGDKVCVKSLDKLVSEFGESNENDIIYTPSFYFTYRKRQYCGTIVTIVRDCGNYYCIEEDNRAGYWTDEMFEPIDHPNTDDNIKYIAINRCSNAIVCKDNNQGFDTLEEIKTAIIKQVNYDKNFNDIFYSASDYIIYAFCKQYKIEEETKFVIKEL